MVYYWCHGTTSRDGCCTTDSRWVVSVRKGPEVGGITAVVVTGVSALVTADVSGAAIVVVETLCEESVDSGVADCLTLILC